MKTTDFQKRILTDIKRELEQDRIPLDKLSEVAAAALKLASDHPQGLEHQAILEFIAKFPECHFQIQEEIAQEEQRASEALAAELRKRIYKK